MICQWRSITFIKVIGGHCISVDPWFLVETAPDITPLIHTTRWVNDAQPQFVVELVRRVLGDLKGKRIAALGLAYKADVDDIRESPAVEIVKLLLAEGAQVSIFEPYKTDINVSGTYATPYLDDAIHGADAVILLVDHKQFRKLDPKHVAEIMTGRTIVDTRNVWDKQSWEALGFDFYVMGKSKINDQ